MDKAAAATDATTFVCGASSVIDNSRISAVATGIDWLRIASWLIMPIQLHRVIVERSVLSGVTEAHRLSIGLEISSDF